jgi:hypothetical protein
VLTLFLDALREARWVNRRRVCGGAFDGCAAPVAYIGQLILACSAKRLLLQFGPPVFWCVLYLLLRRSMRRRFSAAAS